MQKISRGIFAALAMAAIGLMSSAHAAPAATAQMQESIQMGPMQLTRTLTDKGVLTEHACVTSESVAGAVTRCQSSTVKLSAKKAKAMADEMAGLGSPQTSIVGDSGKKSSNFLHYASVRSLILGSVLTLNQSVSSGASAALPASYSTSGFAVERGVGSSANLKSIGSSAQK